MLVWGTQAHSWISGVPQFADYSASVGGAATCAGSLWCGGHGGAARNNGATLVSDYCGLGQNSCSGSKSPICGFGSRVANPTVAPTAFRAVRTGSDSDSVLTGTCNRFFYVGPMLGCGGYCTNSGGSPVGVHDSSYSLGPTPLVAASAYFAVAVGFDHTCALTSGGAVECWGELLGVNRAPWSVQ